MNEQMPIARSAIIAHEQWSHALQLALAQVQGVPADVVFLFAHSAYAEHFPAMLRRVRRETGASILLGCSGQGVVGTSQEVEDVPSLSLLVLSLPGALLQPVRLTQEMVESCTHPQEWRDQLAIASEDVNAWLLFVDPFQIDSETLIEGLSSAYAGKPMLGGLASGDTTEQRTYVFLNDEVFTDGGVALALGGPYSILPLVSQGCEPIGEAWTITHIQDNGMIGTISNRPAYDLLLETFENLSLETQLRAQRNLLVGLAADEYQDSFERGSFLIRQLMRVGRHKGALAIGALPRAGQTIQFQMRDAATADFDLHALLNHTQKTLLAGQQPVAGILCTCNGRGVAMFGQPHHDATVIAQELGSFPLAGLFGNGEIGPVGKRTFLHSFTASLALIIKV